MVPLKDDPIKVEPVKSEPENDAPSNIILLKFILFKSILSNLVFFISVSTNWILIIVVRFGCANDEKIEPFKSHLSNIQLSIILPENIVVSILQLVKWTSLKLDCCILALSNWQSLKLTSINFDILRFVLLNVHLLKSISVKLDLSRVPSLKLHLSNTRLSKGNGFTNLVEEKLTFNNLFPYISLKVKLFKLELLKFVLNVVMHIF